MDTDEKENQPRTEVRRQTEHALARGSRQTSFGVLNGDDKALWVQQYPPTKCAVYKTLGVIGS